MAGFSISFYDDSWTYLGGQEYIHATDSGYRASLGSSTFAVFYQPANTPTHYSFTMPQLLANVPGVVEGDVSWVSITFNSYCSWWNSSANGDVWFDNFEVRHIPASLSVAPDPPTAGSLVTFSADGFDPGQACYLGYSVTGLGSTFIPQLGISMDIANARYGSGPVVAATDGTATDGTAHHDGSSSCTGFEGAESCRGPHDCHLAAARPTGRMNFKNVQRLVLG